MSATLAILLFAVTNMNVTGASWSEKSMSVPFMRNSRRGGSTVYGRISATEYILTPQQIEAFHRDGCITIPDLLTDSEVDPLADVFDRFVSGEIRSHGHDFCDMSQPYDTPYEEWNLVNCMLPRRYYPALQGNVYEKLSHCIAQQLFASTTMQLDYDQLLNKRPGKQKAVFAWHQDMAYWPGPKALGVNATDTCTFSLALDDSDQANGCLQYVVGSGTDNVLRPHRSVCSDRSEGHALTTDLLETDVVRTAPARRGSLTIHNEYVVHGSMGNTCSHRQRRTYVVAYRAQEIVQAEREIGFTHSHNDKVNWDTFDDGEEHRKSA